MSFRIEEKIVLTKWELKKLQNELLLVGLKNLYPPRIIRSYYFDTNCMNMYIDSEEGIVPRKKIRIRDYPKESSTKSIEVKISSYEGRFKTSKILSSYENHSMIQNGKIDKLYGVCRAKIIVTYLRSYYTLRGIRITFDENIEYNKFNSSITMMEKYNVMELKTKYFKSKEFINRLISLPRRRFSKYGRGCELLNLV